MKNKQEETKSLLQPSINKSKEEPQIPNHSTNQSLNFTSTSQPPTTNSGGASVGPTSGVTVGRAIPGGTKGETALPGGITPHRLTPNGDSHYLKHQSMNFNQLPNYQRSSTTFFSFNTTATVTRPNNNNKTSLSSSYTHKRQSSATTSTTSNSNYLSNSQNNQFPKNQTPLQMQQNNSNSNMGQTNQFPNLPPPVYLPPPLPDGTIIHTPPPLLPPPPKNTPSRMSTEKPPRKTPNDMATLNPQPNSAFPSLTSKSSSNSLSSSSSMSFFPRSPSPSPSPNPTPTEGGFGFGFFEGLRSGINDLLDNFSDSPPQPKSLSDKKTLHFGQPLVRSFELAQEKCQVHVSLLCISFIEKNVEEEGLFRIPGSNSKALEWKTIIDSGSDLDFKPSDSAHDVASFLKMYLREIPEGLIVSTDFVRYCALGASDLPNLDEVSSLINTLPVTNKLILQKFIHLLYKISQKSQINKMTANNLSLCLATNVMKSGKVEESPQDILEYTTNVQKIFRLIVAEYPVVFGKVQMK